MLGRRNSIIFWLLFLYFYSVLLFGEKVVNPGIPLNQNAGCQIKLKEVMRIEDRGEDYFFRYLSELKIAPDGTIFIKDWKQLYQFSPDGKYLCNYYKEGQGPGECVYPGNFLFDKENFIIHSVNPAKVMFFDLKGRYKREFRIIKRGGFLDLLLYYNKVFYFSGSSIPEIKGEAAVVDEPQHLFAVSRDGEEIKECISFPVKKYVGRGKSGARGSIPINELIAVPYQEKFLIINHTPEYLIKLFDVEKKEVCLTFTRKYNRVKPPPGFKIKSGVILYGKRFTAPTPEYMNDIEKIFACKDKIWVYTSTKDKKKGTLLDIFDSKGVYEDNFYLKLSGELLAIQKDYLFIRETDEDETPFIVKYQKMQE